MLQYVVSPTRRSTAEAFQILVSHAFGDAGSPYLIGSVSVVLTVWYIHILHSKLNENVGVCWIR